MVGAIMSKKKHKKVNTVQDNTQAKKMEEVKVTKKEEKMITIEEMKALRNSVNNFEVPELDIPSASNIVIKGDEDKNEQAAKILDALIAAIDSDGNMNTSFLSGLIQGSSNLVNNDNSSTVLNTLSSLAGLNINSESLKSTATKSVVSGLLSKLGSKSSSSSSNSTASQAGSLLTTLFSTLK